MYALKRFKPFIDIIKDLQNDIEDPSNDDYIKAWEEFLINPKYKDNEGLKQYLRSEMIDNELKIL